MNSKNILLGLAIFILLASGVFADNFFFENPTPVGYDNYTNPWRENSAIISITTDELSNVSYQINYTNGSQSGIMNFLNTTFAIANYDNFQEGLNKVLISIDYGNETDNVTLGIYVDTSFTINLIDPTSCVNINGNRNG